MNSPRFSLLIMLLCGGMGCACSHPVVPKLQGPCPVEILEPRPEAGRFGLLDALLRSTVRDGRVDYRCLHEHSDLLDRAVSELEATDPSTLGPREQLAYWINAYNAFTLQLIVRHYPEIDSIKQIPERWDREDWQVGGRKISLSAIEHEILRKKFHEPRIHFAIVCASFSCPDLRPEAYLPERLDEQLDEAVRGFFGNASKGSYVTHDGDVFLSPILDWFEEDFVKAAGSVAAFVAPFVGDEARKILEEKGDGAIEFMDYDWRLNGG